MAEENRVTSRQMQMSEIPRDLSTPSQSGNPRPEEEDDCVEIELSLGLSLNGRFGVDPRRASNLTRSASLIPMQRANNNDSSAIPFAIPIRDCGTGRDDQNLIRTRSLPVLTAEEWKKRKALQTQRRMEAKRKRSEKKKAAARDRNRGPGEVVNSQDLDSGFQWVNGFPRAGLGNDKNNNGFVGGAAAGGGGSPGSIGSQGSGSSSSVVLDFEYQPAVQGIIKGTEERSPISVQPLPKPPVSHGSIVIDRTRSNSRVSMENPCNKPTATNNQPKETGRNALEDMPCVYTKGDGPDGKKIEGFLYRYKKGEEVKIMCVCHGIFHSPAEFVKHAGCSDVAQPLKHIVVNPSPPLV